VVIVGKVCYVGAELGSVEDAGKTGLLLKVADLANALQQGQVIAAPSLSF
jgi:hypothetical protein